MQQLEEGGVENPFQRTPQDGGKAENSSRTSFRTSKILRKLADHYPLTGILLIALFMCFLYLFLGLRHPCPDNKNNLTQLQQPQLKENVPTKTDNIELVRKEMKQKLEDQEKLFQKAKNETETQVKFLEERNRQLTLQVESHLQTTTTTTEASLKTEVFSLDDMKSLLDLLYKSKVPKTEVDTCGGAFEISREPSRFRYEKPSNTSEVGRPCIWVMWTVLAPKMKVRLLYLSGEVTIYVGFGSNWKNVAGFQTWSTATLDPFKETVLPSSVAVVVFTPKPEWSTTSTPKDMMEIALQGTDQLLPPIKSNVTMTTLTASRTVLRGDQLGFHQLNKKSFTFIYPPFNGKVYYQVIGVDTQWGHDFLSIYKYSNNTRQFEFVRKYEGRLGHVKPPASVESYRNQPILLYYQTEDNTYSMGYAGFYHSTY